MLKKAIHDLKNGKMVILIDDEGRENEGDLIFPAELVTPEKISTMLKYCSGIICVSIEKARADKLDLAFMVDQSKNNSAYQTPFTVSVEAKKGVATGVSASDRAVTIQTLIGDATTHNDLARPGHVFPLIAHDHGVLGREGHTEGALDLIKLAGFKSGAVLCELMNADGSMMNAKDLKQFSERQEITRVTIKELIQFRHQNESLVEKLSTSQIVLAEHGEFDISIFKNKLNQEEAVVLSKAFKEKNPLVRLHSACFTGDVLESLHCDCRSQLNYSLNKIAMEGGVLLYLNQEGRGIGLANKIKAYALQQQGFDTVDANIELGFPADARCYHFACQILKAIGLTKIRLMTNNPKKYESLTQLGLSVTVENIPSKTNPYNQQYLAVKRDKLNHQLELDK